MMIQRTWLLFYILGCFFLAGRVFADPYAPTLVFHDPEHLSSVSAEGMVVIAWKGLLAWQHLPPASPLMVRAYDAASGRWLLEPRFLLEAFFDLEDVPEPTAPVLLELLLIEGNEAPDPAVLRRPARELVGSKEIPIYAVLQTKIDLRRNTPKASEGASPSALVGFRRVGTLPETSIELRCSEAQHLAGLNLEAAWSCFWETLGPAVLPEILLYDFDELQRITDRLRKLGPEDWRASFAEAQVATLREDHGSALALLKETLDRCPDQRCKDLEVSLRNFVEVDRRSSFNRTLHSGFQELMSPQTLDYLTEIRGKAFEALDELGETMDPVAHTWYAGAQLRWHYSGIETTRFALPSKNFESFATSQQEGILFGDEMGELGELLKYSMRPHSPVGPGQWSAEGFSSVAAIFHLEHVPAPHGGTVALDIAPPKPSSYATYSPLGLDPPELLPTDPARSAGAVATAALNRSPTLFPVQAGRRVLVEAYLRWIQEDHEGVEAALRQASIAFRGRQTQRDLAAIDVLRAANQLAWDEGRLETALRHLKAAVHRADASSSDGRSLSLLTAWEELARRHFYRDRRYAEAVELIREAGWMLAPTTPPEITLQILLLPINFFETLGMPAALIQQTKETVSILEARIQENLDIRDTLQDLLAKISTTIPPEEGEFVGLVQLCSGILQVRQKRAFAQAELGEPWQKAADEIGASRKSVNTLLHGEQAPGREEDTEGQDEPVNLDAALMRALSEASDLADDKLCDFFVDIHALMDASLSVSAALAAQDYSGAQQVAKGIEGSNLYLILQVVEGNLQILESLEKEIEGFSQLLASLDSGENDPLSSLGFQVEQSLMQLRELYFFLCARDSHIGSAPHSCRVDKEHKSWLSSPLSGPPAKRIPWKGSLVAAQVAEAEARQADAFALYRQTIEHALKDERSHELQNRTTTFNQARENAYQGAARTALRLDSDSRQKRALSLLDEHAWIQGEARLGRPALEIPAMPDLEELATDIDPHARLLFITGTDARDRLVWIYSADRGLRFRRFSRDYEIEPTHPNESLRRYTFHDPGSAVLDPRHLWSRITAWISEEIPPDAPVAFILSGTMRSLGGHRLWVDGEPLAIRNPTVTAPSFRRLAAVVTAERSGQSRWWVGVPEVEDGSTERALQPFADRARLETLAGSLGGGVLWEDATVENVIARASNAAWLHFSAHGVVEPLYPEKTGLVLKDGMLSLSRARELGLPGSVVVLSACNTGDWGDPAAETAGTLDLVFLDAGASTVISSAVPVQLPVASTWMDAFYEGISRGLDPSRAGQHAYRTTRDAHPAESWGAFTVVGHGGHPLQRQEEPGRSGDS